MTPEQKAVELLTQYRRHLPINTVTDLEVKGCASIAVNEIIDAIDWHHYETPNVEINYWLDVRKEIEKL